MVYLLLFSLQKNCKPLVQIDYGIPSLIRAQVLLLTDSYTLLFFLVHSYTLTSANNPGLVFFKQLSDTDIAAADL